MPATAPSEARIHAAIKAAQACGLPIAEVRVERDGTLRVLTTPGRREGGNSCDEVFGCET